MGTLGKAVGSFAEIFFWTPAGAASSISNTMAFDMGRKGRRRWRLVGLAVGAAAFGAYEVLKQSYEHPDRAPDLAALI
jgi:hypothetical protein